MARAECISDDSYVNINPSPPPSLWMTPNSQSTDLINGQVMNDGELGRAVTWGHQPGSGTLPIVSLYKERWQCL